MAKNNRRVRKRTKAGKQSYYDISSLPGRIRIESQTERKREQKRRRKHILWRVQRQEIYLLYR